MSLEPGSRVVLADMLDEQLALASACHANLSAALESVDDAALASAVRQAASVTAGRGAGTGAGEAHGTESGEGKLLTDVLATLAGAAESGGGGGRRGPLMYHVVVACDELIQGAKSDWLGGEDMDGVPGGVVPAITPDYMLAAGAASKAEFHRVWSALVLLVTWGQGEADADWSFGDAWVWAGACILHLLRQRERSAICGLCPLETPLLRRTHMCCCIAACGLCPLGLWLVCARACKSRSL